MEGFDLSRSLHSAFAPIDNDAYKWQRIFDTRLQWQMQNEKEKNDLKRLRISDATKQMGALSGLQLDIVPGSEQEYAQSLLNPIKEAVNEIYGGLMSGQDSEYYLEEAGNVFNYVHNLLNKDERLRNAIRNSAAINTTKANMEKILQDKTKFSSDGIYHFNNLYNKVMDDYNKGKINLQQVASELSGFNAQQWGSLDTFREEAHKIGMNMITKQNDSKNNIGFQTLKEAPNHDSVKSLLARAVQFIGGSFNDIIEYKDKDGKAITLDEFNQIKDDKEKQKYTLGLITDFTHCGNNLKCQRVIGEVASALPGFKSQRTYNKYGEYILSKQLEDDKLENSKALETFKYQQELNKLQVQQKFQAAQNTLEGLYKLLEKYPGTEQEQEIKAEINRTKQYIENLGKPTTEYNQANAGKHTPTLDESAFNDQADPNSDNPMNSIFVEPLHDLTSQTVEENETKDDIKKALMNMFVELNGGEEKYISTKDKDGDHINPEFAKFIDQFIDEGITDDKLKEYIDKGMSYKDIFNDLYSKKKPGFWGTAGNVAVRLLSKIGVGSTTMEDRLDNDLLSQASINKVNKETDIVKKYIKPIIIPSQLAEANSEAQHRATDYVKNSNVTLSEVGGEEIDKSKIRNVVGLNYVDNRIYIAADIEDINGKNKRVNLSVDAKQSDLVLEELRNIIVDHDANNTLNRLRNNNHAHPYSRINYNIATNKSISYAIDTIYALTGINSIPVNERKKLSLMRKKMKTGDYTTQRTITYTGGSIPIEISFNVDEDNNSINNVVTLRGFTYVKEGGKMVKKYYKDEKTGMDKFYFDISGGSSNYNRIMQAMDTLLYRANNFKPKKDDKGNSKIDDNNSQ